MLHLIISDYGMRLTSMNINDKIDLTLIGILFLQ